MEVPSFSSGPFSCSHGNQQETLVFVLEPPPKLEIIGMWLLWVSDTPETGIPRFLAAGSDNLRDSDGFDHSRTELGSACDLVRACRTSRRCILSQAGSLGSLPQAD